jgi:hypothetical protein
MHLVQVKTGATGSNLEMVERQMMEAVGAGGKGAAAQCADNIVFRLKIQRVIIKIIKIELGKLGTR